MIKSLSFAEFSVYQTSHPLISTFLPNCWFQLLFYFSLRRISYRIVLGYYFCSFVHLFCNSFCLLKDTYSNWFFFHFHISVFCDTPFVLLSFLPQLFFYHNTFHKCLESSFDKKLKNVDTMLNTTNSSSPVFSSQLQWIDVILKPSCMTMHKALMINFLIL